MKETTKKNSLELPREVLKASGLANGQELGALSLDGVVLLTRDSMPIVELLQMLDTLHRYNYQIGKYGRLRRNYLKEYHPVLYANFLTSGTLHRHLAEIDQACNERMEIIISDMAKQDGVTETLKVADQMEWVRRMNSIRSRAEEIVLTELVYE